MSTATDRLVAAGKQAFNSPPHLYPFTRNAAANELLNDLKNYPHAFVMACIADRQDRTERPWLLPYRLFVKLGTFDFAALRACSNEQFVLLVSKPTPLCRYPRDMGMAISAALSIIEFKYDSNAANIWSGRPSSADVVYRFLELPGIGIKIATMAANILARTFKVPYSDYYSVDISPDRHVRRVFARLGLASKKASDDELIYRARAISPEFPGLLDGPAFDLGRTCCRERRPICSQCLMQDVCPTARATAASS